MTRAVTISMLLLAAGLSTPRPAAGGVPSACVHPRADRLACREAMQRERREVLPAARLRALEAQRGDLLRVAPRQDLERNRLLWEIRQELRARPR